MTKYLLDHQKIMWHKERVEAWLRGERIAPITIDCALTRRCNYKCIYCYGMLQENEGIPLLPSVINRFLDDAAEIGVKAVSFVSDGESTCNPYYVKAIQRGYRNGLDMAIGTNGFLLKDEDLEAILPCLTYLRFNISAGEPARYSYIHGCSEAAFHKVVSNIRKAVEIKWKNRLGVTIGLQMVLMPEFAEDVLPLAKLGRELGVDYLVIKHCSDDENGSLGVDYEKYAALIERLKDAESMSTENYQVSAKWSKIMSKGKRSYSRCFGPPFILQLSGSGLVAPCGMLFNTKYARYHIGNISEKSFKEIWQSERYWEVMDLIASDQFNAHTMCGCLCLQHKVNEFLADVKKNPEILASPVGACPTHINFI